MTYDEAMKKYGSDKPDLRYSLEMTDLSDIATKIESNVIQNSLKNSSILKGLVAKNWHNLGRKDFDRLTDLVKKQGAGGLIYISIPENIEGKINLEQTAGPLNKFYTQENLDEWVGNFYAYFDEYISAISKALVNYNSKFRIALKKEGLLTRDSRVVERKKYGRRKARRSFQFSKR